MKDLRVITITLNPAYDIHCSAPNLELYKRSIAEMVSMEIGGKGVNISRALKANGKESVAVVVVGSSNATEYCKALEKEQLTYIGVWTEGRIRQNLVFYKEGEEETRISFNGFVCDESVLSKIEHRIGNVDENTMIAFAGLIPQGIRIERMKEWLIALKNKGVKLVVDSRSLSFDDLIDLQPWLIKISKEESKNYFGVDIENVEQAAQYAKKACSLGVENVIISMGAEGAVYANGTDMYKVIPPALQAVSTIGAGDGLIAGYIDGYIRDDSTQKILQRAVAYGVATCMQKGTTPPQSDSVEGFIGDVKVVAL